MAPVTMERALVPPTDGELKTRVRIRSAHGPVLRRMSGLPLA